MVSDIVGQKAELTLLRLPDATLIVQTPCPIPVRRTEPDVVACNSGIGHIYTRPALEFLFSYGRTGSRDILESDRKDISKIY